MKSIKTLIKDVYDVASQDNWFAPAAAERYSAEMAHRVMERLIGEERAPTLRLSAMGEICPRSLWASIHTPGLRERTPPHARIKFHFGDVIEAMAIALAKAAGHSVTGEQDECSLLGVKGHRDCVIDGNIVDVKSINSLGFQKVQMGLVATDTFLRSYLDQLDGYLLAAANDPLVINKQSAYIWFVDKVLGHMKLYEHRLREDHILARIRSHKAIVGQAVPPVCTCETKPEGASGNIKLGLKASYNAWKFACFPECRCFIYAGGKPTYLVKVMREPNVPEVDRNGVFVV